MIKYRVFEKETGELYECENIHYRGKEKKDS